MYTWNNKIISTVCKLDQMLQDLKETQRVNDNSKKCYQKTQISQPEPDESMSDKTESPDVDLKRTKRDAPEPLDKPNEVRVVVLGMAKFIRESSKLKDTVKLHDSRFYALNNKDINDQTQVNEIFQKITENLRQRIIQTAWECKSK